MDLYMKILLFTSIFPPDIGGPATFVSQFSNVWEAERSLTVATFRNHRNLKIILNQNKKYPLYEIPFKKHPFLRSIYALFFLIRMRKHYDLIYCHGSVWDTGLPALVTKIFRKKIIIKITGDSAWERAVQYYSCQDSLEKFYDKKYSLRIELLKFIQKKVAFHSHKIIVPSFYCQKIVQNWGIPADKIEVVYNAVHPPITVEKKENSFIKPFILLTICRLVKHKDIDELIDFVKDLTLEIPNIELHIIGAGPESIRLLPHVKYLGAMPYENCFNYYKASDVFILNSQYEGFSHVLLEAMSFGLPCVASAVGGNVELIVHETNGYLFQKGDFQKCKEIILSLYKNIEVRSQISQEARKTTKKFDYPQLLSKHYRVFQEVVK